MSLTSETSNAVTHAKNKLDAAESELLQFVSRNFRHDQAQNLVYVGGRGRETAEIELSRLVAVRDIAADAFQSALKQFSAGAANDTI